MNSIIDFILGIDRIAWDKGAEWRLVWRNMPETWLLALVIIPLILFIPYFFYKREGKNISGIARFALGCLRSLIIFIILLILFQPIILLETERVRYPYLIVLIDDSRSMTLQDKFTRPEEIKKLAELTQLVDDKTLPETDMSAKVNELRRIDMVNKILANSRLDILKKLSTRYQLKTYGFSGGLVSEPKTGRMEAQGDSTAIGDAIAEALKELRGQSIAAVVVISDGRSNSGMDVSEAINLLVDRDSAIPVYTIAAGNPSEPKDIELLSLSAPEIAVAKDPVKFEVIVKHQGFAGETAEIRLNQGGKTVDTKLITLAQDKTEQHITVGYVPDTPGEYEITITVPPRPDEFIEENNTLKHFLIVKDEKIRVLFVEGYPRWEYQYLKNALLRDHSIIVNCLLLSADTGFPQESTKGEPSLTEFPYEKKDLFKYDVIIFGDVEPVLLASLNTPSHDEIMKTIEEFVEQMGGGFLMISGPRSSPRAYKDTSVGRMLPVVIPDDDGTIYGQSGVVQAEPFQPKLTPEGAMHEITRLDSDPAKNKKLWEDPNEGLPGMYWYYPLKRVKPAAKVLAAHPNESDAQKPLVAVQQYKRGRTMFVGFDSTWRWRKLIGDKYFYQFWAGSIHYLRGGRLFSNKRYQLTTDKLKYSLGEKVKIYARVFDEEFNPLTYPVISASLELPDGIKKNLELTLDPKEPGSYFSAFSPDRLGNHKVSLGPEDITATEEVVFKAFSVEHPSREFEQPLVDRQTLEFIAQRTEGKFLGLADIETLPEAIKEAREVREYMSKEEPIWDAPLFFLLFLLIIAAEWIVRKALRLI